jgi:hypothetical protein
VADTLAGRTFGVQAVQWRLTPRKDREPLLEERITFLTGQRLILRSEAA